MSYKWASPKTNPAAHYLPQIFSFEEERLLYRCLCGAAVETERRGAAAGPLQIKGSSTEYVSAEQEAVLRALETSDGSAEDVQLAVKDAITRSKDRRPQSARKWVKRRAGKRFEPSDFDSWAARVAALPQRRRLEAVVKLRRTAISRELYATPVLSGTIGFFGRDSQNPWGRVCGWNRDHPFAFNRALPLIRRIDEAFRLTMPTRYEAQKRFCDRLDQRFVIPGTCFTTITVNKNFRTYPHRDSGDLSQGMSNLSVFSNGRAFTGGHLVLPEFNVEFALAPRDLLFIANHEYIHENTSIVSKEPDSERMSIVCYAREDLAFCGSVEYEELRRQFKLKHKNFSGMWGSRKWFDFLRFKLAGDRAPPPASYLVDEARQRHMLNKEILMLSVLHERDALCSTISWEYVAEIPPPSNQQRETLAALMSALHFKTPRQDKWDDDDGPVEVDALFIGVDRWAIAYCESESGSVRLPNNRFNVQAVGRVEFLPSLFSRLSRDAADWMLDRWAHKDSVYVIRVPTYISEAPHRYALTTLPKTADWRQREEMLSEAWGHYYQAAGTSFLKNTWGRAPQSTLLYELGFSHGSVERGGLAESPQNAVCDSFEIREEAEKLFLNGELDHWKARALNVASNDFRARYERIGTYSLPRRPLEKSVAGSPWKAVANSNSVVLKKARRWASTLKIELASKGGLTTGSWSSNFQSFPVLATTVGADASLLLWRYKDQPLGGQLAITNGETYWLFQAIASATPIRKNSRPPTTRKIIGPAVVGHLQRTPAYWRADKSKLEEKLRARAELVPSPFSRMSEDRLLEYGSGYRKGRANVLAIGGPPASGKTFILRQLIAKADDWKALKKGRLLDCMYSDKLKLYVCVFRSS